MASDTSTSPPACSHLTKQQTRCKHQASTVYNGVPLCNKHLKYVKAREECAVCLQPMTSQDGERIQLSTCAHFFHKTCLTECQTTTCPVCRTPFGTKDNIAIYSKVIFEPFANLLFKYPKQLQYSIVTGLSNVFGRNQERQRTESEIAMFEWAIKIVADAFDNSISHEPIIKLLSMNAAAITYYRDHKTFIGFEYTLE